MYLSLKENQLNKQLIVVQNLTYYYNFISCNKLFVQNLQHDSPPKRLKQLKACEFELGVLHKRYLNLFVLESEKQLVLILLQIINPIGLKYLLNLCFALYENIIYCDSTIYIYTIDMINIDNQLITSFWSHKIVKINYI